MSRTFSFTDIDEDSIKAEFNNGCLKVTVPKAKKQEAKMVRLSKMTVQAQEEKLIEIDKELTVLEKKAQQIRKQNMKEFEAILTREQKQILKNMKKEGRRNFEKGQRPHPPVQRAEEK